MGPQRDTDGLGQHDEPSAAVGLGLQQGQGAVHVRQGVADPQAPRLEVDVLPAQGQELTLAQPRAERRDPERPVAVLDGGLDEPTGLLRGQGCDLTTADPRWVDEPGHVATDEAPALGGHQCSAQDGVDVLDATWGEPRSLLAVQERLDLGRGELGEGNAAELWDEVAFDDLPIALEGRSADPGPGHLVHDPSVCRS